MDEKKIELQRYKNLLLATIEYLMAREIGSMIMDGHDPMILVQESLIASVQKYYSEGRLSKLKSELDKMTSTIKFEADLQFADYIKEKTGEKFDLFAGLDDQINQILEQGKIVNDKEDFTVMVQLQIYKKTGADPEKEMQLIRLMSEYVEKKQPDKEEMIYERTRRYEDGKTKQITVHSSMAQPLYDDEWVAFSPDGKRRLQVWKRSRDGKDDSTSVNILFEGRVGPVLAARGVHLGLKAYWRDNNTVVIEMPKGIDAFAQHFKLQSFDDVVMIEYLTI